MKDFIKDLIIAVLVAVVLIQFIKPVIVRESSMENNFIEGDYLIVSKQSYSFGEVKRGDVVVFKSELLDEKGNEKLLIKRVIGLPGENVQVTDGKVYIDGIEIEEDYIKDGTTNGEVDVTVPEDEYFCMGDNRLVSIDSRDESVGCVPAHELLGKVVLRAFPFKKFGRIESPDYNI
ncbi:MAG: signal peptidase I [Firmicutes bacterium]|nr:signal peptidase I [Bacillota bacterium]